MRSRTYWILGLLAGVATAVATYELAGWHFSAVGTGLLWFGIVGPGGAASAELKARTGVSRPYPGALWGGLYGLLSAIGWSIVVSTRSLSTGEELAVMIVAFGLSGIGLTYGIRVALLYQDAGGDSGSVADGSHAAGQPGD